MKPRYLVYVTVAVVLAGTLSPTFAQDTGTPDKESSTARIGGVAAFWVIQRLAAF